MKTMHIWLYSARAWIIVLLATIVIVIAYYVAANRITPITTDAYVQSFVVQIAPRVDGQVIEVMVEDGSKVKAGDPLFRLDPTPYQFEVDHLRASLALAQSTIQGLQAQLEFFDAVVKQRKADVDYAQETYNRISKLAKDSFAAQQKLDEATDTLRTDTALLNQAKADLVNIQAELGSMTGDEHSEVAQVRAELKTAEFNLEQTTIYAAIDGVVDNMQLRAGTFLEAGDYVMTLIDDTERWIVANYQENALSVIKPGQSVLLSFFMYPGRIFEGKVSAIGSGVYKGQGLADGLLANVDNPSAWITLSQRFQVRVDPQVEADIALRVGGTVRVMIFTGEYPVMNALGRFWVWVGTRFDFVF